jgi:hypothetical protein
MDLWVVKKTLPGVNDFVPKDFSSGLMSQHLTRTVELEYAISHGRIPTRYPFGLATRYGMILGTM